MANDFLTTPKKKGPWLSSHKTATCCFSSSSLFFFIIISCSFFLIYFFEIIKGVEHLLFLFTDTKNKIYFPPVQRSRLFCSFTYLRVIVGVFLHLAPPRYIEEKKKKTVANACKKNKREKVKS